MLKYISLFILSVLTLSVSVPRFAAAQDITGLWLTENKRSVINIRDCDQGLCGDIHWIIADGMQYDRKNPDVERRDTPMCGLPILWGFKQNGNEWSDGKIYKADEGDTYNANMTLLNDGRLRLRGYIGLPLFGKTQIWTRVSAVDYPKCD